jgi:hypothetical protein
MGEPGCNERGSTVCSASVMWSRSIIEVKQAVGNTFQVWCWSKFKFKILFLPRRKHHVFITKTVCLMLFWKIIAYCENLTKRINALCGLSAHFFKRKTCGRFTCMYHLALEARNDYYALLCRLQVLYIQMSYIRWVHLSGTVSCASGRAAAFYII